MAIHLLNPRSLYRLADGMHTDGGGLYLRVQKNGQSRTWAFRFQRKGKRVQVSLGSLADVTITDARQLSKQLNRCLVAGDDPVEYLKSLTAEAEPLTDMTFAGLLPYALKSVEDRKLWKNAKSKMQWENTLRDYALPKLGRKDIDAITSKDIISVLQPIWETKTETAKRLMGRLKEVFDWAIAQGYYTRLNPATWDTLRFTLPPPERVRNVEHFKAVSIENVPKLYQHFLRKNSVSGNAICFGILTASRVGEFRLAEWTEVDFAKGVWSVPPCRRKDGVKAPHRVPLSRQAQRLLKRIKDSQPVGEKFLFPGYSGKAICADTPRQMLLKNGFECTMHGMRSVFMDWCAETEKDWIASEKALSHAVGTKVTRAYLRTDMLNARRDIMQAWADYLG